MLDHIISIGKYTEYIYWGYQMKNGRTKTEKGGRRRLDHRKGVAHWDVNPTDCPAAGKEKGREDQNTLS